MSELSCHKAIRYQRQPQAAPAEECAPPTAAQDTDDQATHPAAQLKTRNIPPNGSETALPAKDLASYLAADSRSIKLETDAPGPPPAPYPQEAPPPPSAPHAVEPRASSRDLPANAFMDTEALVTANGDAAAAGATAAAGNSSDAAASGAGPSHTGSGIPSATPGPCPVVFMATWGRSTLKLPVRSVQVLFGADMLATARRRLVGVVVYGRTTTKTDVVTTNSADVVAGDGQQPRVLECRDAQLRVLHANCRITRLTPLMRDLGVTDGTRLRVVRDAVRGGILVEPIPLQQEANLPREQTIRTQGTHGPQSTARMDNGPEPQPELHPRLRSRQPQPQGVVSSVLPQQQQQQQNEQKEQQQQQQVECARQLMRLPEVKVEAPVQVPAQSAQPPQQPVVHVWLRSCQSHWRSTQLEPPSLQPRPAVAPALPPYVVAVKHEEDDGAHLPTGAALGPAAQMEEVQVSSGGENGNGASPLKDGDPAVAEDDVAGRGCGRDIHGGSQEALLLSAQVPQQPQQLQQQVKAAAMRDQPEGISHGLEGAMQNAEEEMAAAAQGLAQAGAAATCVQSIGGEGDRSLGPGQHQVEEEGREIERVDGGVLVEGTLQNPADCQPKPLPAAPAAASRRLPSLCGPVALRSGAGIALTLPLACSSGAKANGAANGAGVHPASRQQQRLRLAVLNGPGVSAPTAAAAGVDYGGGGSSEPPSSRRCLAKWMLVQGVLPLRVGHLATWQTMLGCLVTTDGAVRAVALRGSACCAGAGAAGAGAADGAEAVGSGGGEEYVGMGWLRRQPSLRSSASTSSCPSSSSSWTVGGLQAWMRYVGARPSDLVEVRAYWLGATGLGFDLRLSRRTTAEEGQPREAMATRARRAVSATVPVAAAGEVPQAAVSAMRKRRRVMSPAPGDNEGADGEVDHQDDCDCRSEGGEGRQQGEGGAVLEAAATAEEAAMDADAEVDATAAIDIGAPTPGGANAAPPEAGARVDYGDTEEAAMAPAPDVRPPSKRPCTETATAGGAFHAASCPPLPAAAAAEAVGANNNAGCDRSDPGVDAIRPMDAVAGGGAVESMDIAAAGTAGDLNGGRSVDEDGGGSSDPAVATGDATSAGSGGRTPPVAEEAALHKHYSDDDVVQNGLGLPPLRPGELRLCGLTFHPDLVPSVLRLMSEWQAALSDSLVNADPVAVQIQLPFAFTDYTTTAASATAAAFKEHRLSANVICSLVARLLGLMAEDSEWDAPLPAEGLELAAGVAPLVYSASEVPDGSKPGRCGGGGGAAGLVATAPLRRNAVLGVVGGYVMPAGAAARFASRGFRDCSGELVSELRQRAAPADLAVAWRFVADAFRMPYPGLDLTPEGAAGPVPLEISMLGYGNMAALINDPRVRPQAWLQDNDVDCPPPANCVTDGRTDGLNGVVPVLPVCVRGLTLPVLVALRDIAPGEPLLRDYGAAWWRELGRTWEVLDFDGVTPEQLLLLPTHPPSPQQEMPPQQQQQHLQRQRHIQTQGIGEHVDPPSQPSAPMETEAEAGPSLPLHQLLVSAAETKNTFAPQGATVQLVGAAGTSSNVVQQHGRKCVRAGSPKATENSRICRSSAGPVMMTRGGGTTCSMYQIAATDGATAASMCRSISFRLGTIASLPAQHVTAERDRHQPRHDRSAAIDPQLAWDPAAAAAAAIDSAAAPAAAPPVVQDHGKASAPGSERPRHEAPSLVAKRRTLFVKIPEPEQAMCGISPTATTPTTPGPTTMSGTAGDSGAVSGLQVHLPRSVIETPNKLYGAAAVTLTMARPVPHTISGSSSRRRRSGQAALPAPLLVISDYLNSVNQGSWRSISSGSGRVGSVMASGGGGGGGHARRGSWGSGTRSLGTNVKMLNGSFGAAATSTAAAAAACAVAAGTAAQAQFHSGCGTMVQDRTAMMHWAARQTGVRLMDLGHKQRAGNNTVPPPATSVAVRKLLPVAAEARPEAEAVAEVGPWRLLEGRFYGGDAELFDHGILLDECAECKLKVRVYLLDGSGRTIILGHKSFFIPHRIRKKKLSVRGNGGPCGA
ncbi:hypothetical protein VOLCADRAFT_104332 [Volvox carteri f. nagariensis]|uniref:SET domain-containing protein n=1 Tax=Volvox carteri f. nagariensis TaxID=3068 RepID=D8TSZ0_VOLCA|nr:uncharacterized protein VOLCADRAFT_104332 [Volvox carteri f. nagariensis]EFJ49464.1 hypothetical protein VOLCADRAFT_104332 [Volvox carteri f. nagariensis]|eukprot:XP_002949445.1 hypothetical protein VOLCADRAFT_104332 [Volvox carteri f. nagariensis]